MRESAVVFLAVLAVGCNSSAAPRPVPVAPVRTAPAGSEAPPGTAETTAPNPPGTLTGTILETMDSGGYTYLRLKTAGGEVWAAVNQAAVKKGATVTVVNGMTMDGFESKTLKRKFDHIVFGSLASGASAAAPAGAAASASSQPTMDPQVLAGIAAPHASVASGPADVGEISVKKAEGKDARTVAEIFAGKVALKDSLVAVRGKVVKYNPGILGRNWIHLRDGSGSRDKLDDDITVTTTGTTAVGDVVLVRGTLHLDRDFGAGYAYTVILEDAELVK